MQRSTLLSKITLAVLASTIAFVSFAQAGTGTVVKYSQLPGYLLDPVNPSGHGENIPSDIDWNIANSPDILQQLQGPNWIAADDFQDPFDTPVLTVRWWGSYFGPTFQSDPTGTNVPIFGPGSEDGYVLSFFTDRPAVTIPGTPIGIPSQPEELLASYIAPLDVVKITPTGQIGWDNHEIWEYQVDLMDAHLEHAVAGMADPDGFNQLPGEIYWLAINAEVGHTLIEVTQADGTVSWVEQDTGKFAQPNANHPEGHFWGWHTSPEVFNDDAAMGHLLMGPGGEWIYPEDSWNPIDAQHGPASMAFQLLTIPEPASAILLGLGGLAIMKRS